MKIERYHSTPEQMIADRIGAMFGTARLIVSGVFGQKRKKLVLVVERDAETLRLINAIMRRVNNHCEILYAGNGAEAFASVCSRPPDVIIANAKLRGINGFRFVDNIKMDMHARKIPLILTTGLTRAALLTSLLTNFRGIFPQGALG
jgi:CheY-like chemotaxis protein